MNWFNRHLNWSWILAWVLCLLTAFLVGVAIGATAPGTPDEAFDAIGIVLTLAIMLPASIFVLKAKDRSLWWLLLSGWFSPLWLSNKKLEKRVGGQLS